MVSALDMSALPPPETSDPGQFTTGKITPCARKYNLISMMLL